MQQLMEYRNPFLEEMETEFERYKKSLHAICRRYFNEKWATKFSYDDFFGYASIGFVKAYKNYHPDSNKQTKFISYLYTKAISEIKTALRDYSYEFHVHRTVKELVTKINYLQLVDEDPYLVAEIIQAPIEVVLETIDFIKKSKITSLNAPLFHNGNGDKEMTWNDLLIDTTQMFPRYEEIEVQEAKKELHSLLEEVLSEKEYLAVQYVYREGKPQSVAGKLIGCSQMQVSRYIRSAKNKLQEYKNRFNIQNEFSVSI